jgi:hypothetical protein
VRTVDGTPGSFSPEKQIDELVELVEAGLRYTKIIDEALQLTNR